METNVNETNHDNKNFESLQISEPSISNSSHHDEGIALPFEPKNEQAPVVITNIEPSLKNPITLLVKFIDTWSGKELYCTFMKVEKETNDVEKLNEALLQRWSTKVEGGNQENPNFVKKENIKKVQLKVADRFNQVANIDMDNHFLKDYSLQENDMVFVHL